MWWKSKTQKPGERACHFCDSYGFQKVFFDPDNCPVSPGFMKSDPQNLIRVLLIQPGKYPKEVSIDNSPESMQRVVGGDIEEYMPFTDEVALICCDEGKINGYPLNRAIYDEPKEGKRQILDIIAGDFFLAYAPVSSEKFLSLPDGLMKKYAEIFRYPERFALTENGIRAEPYRPAKDGFER